MPQLSMVLRRAAFGSETKILAAPAACAHRMVNAPIGPAPAISTVLPACTPPRSTAYSATAAGSIIAASSSLIESGTLAAL